MWWRRRPPLQIPQRLEPRLFLVGLLPRLRAGAGAAVGEPALQEVGELLLGGEPLADQVPGLTRIGLQVVELGSVRKEAGVSLAQDVLVLSGPHHEPELARVLGEDGAAPALPVARQLAQVGAVLCRDR